MLFLVMYRWTEDRKDARSVIPEHTRWTFNEQKRGRMIASGPTPDYSIGIQLFNCENLEEVQTICQSEPLVAAGHRTFEIIPWELHAIFGLSLGAPAGPPPAI